MARATGLEPATSGVTGRHSNQLSYAPAFGDAEYSLRLTPVQGLFERIWSKSEPQIGMDSAGAHRPQGIEAAQAVDGI